MARQHTEAAFETAIEEHLLTYGGYTKRTTETFDPKLCLDTEAFLQFIQTPDYWRQHTAHRCLWDSNRHKGSRGADDCCDHYDTQMKEQDNGES